MDKNKFSVVRIDTDVLEELRALAKADGISVPRKLRQLIKYNPIRIPAVNFTGKGDEIGQYFSDQEVEIK